MRGLFRNATWSGAVTAFRTFAGLLNALLAVRLVGVGDYGHLATLLSIFVLYLAMNTSTYTVLVTRLMSPGISGNSQEQSETLSASGLLTAISLALLAMVTVLMFWAAPGVLGLDASTGSHVMGMAILMMGGLTAVQILAALQSAIIEASGRLDMAMKAQSLGPLITLVMLGTAFVMQLPLSAPIYVAMLVASAGVDLCLLWFVRRVILHLLILHEAPSPNMRRVKELLRSGSVLQATSLMNLFLEPMNKLLLNHFAGPVAVTAYDLAMKIIWGIQALFGAAMRVFLHLAHHDGEKVGKAYTQVISLIAVPVVIAHAFGALLLSWVAHRWANIEAPQLMAFYAIATLSNFGMIFITPLYTSLISRGDLRFILRSQIILAATNLLSSIVAIPLIGLVGAAFGLLAATTFNVVAIYSRHRNLVGRIVNAESMLRGFAVRWLITAVIFFVTVWMGALGALSVFWTAVLLVVFLIIGLTEPIIGRILMMLNDGHY